MPTLLILQICGLFVGTAILAAQITIWRRMRVIRRAQIEILEQINRRPRFANGGPVGRVTGAYVVGERG
ncbi:MAG: hypothetical protein ACRYG4_04280 [Janthinobacterium lividum]